MTTELIDAIQGIAILILVITQVLHSLNHQERNTS
jgi:hypothetical protein